MVLLGIFRDKPLKVILLLLAYTLFSLLLYFFDLAFFWLMHFIMSFAVSMVFLLVFTSDEEVICDHKYIGCEFGFLLLVAVYCLKESLLAYGLDTFWTLLALIPMLAPLMWFFTHEGEVKFQHPDQFIQ